MLDGRVHREVGISNNLKAIESRRHFPARTEGGNPGSLHLRKAGDFAEAAQNKSQRRMVTGGEGLGRLTIKRIVQEDFIDDEGEAVLDAELLELGSLD